MNSEWLQVFQTKNTIWTMTANKKWKSKDFSEHLSFNRKRRENCENVLIET